MIRELLILFLVIFHAMIGGTSANEDEDDPFANMPVKKTKSEAQKKPEEEPPATPKEEVKKPTEEEVKKPTKTEEDLVKKTKEEETLKKDAEKKQEAAEPSKIEEKNGDGANADSDSGTENEKSTRKRRRQSTYENLYLKYPESDSDDKTFVANSDQKATIQCIQCKVVQPYLVWTSKDYTDCLTMRNLVKTDCQNPKHDACMIAYDITYSFFLFPRPVIQRACTEKADMERLNHQYCTDPGCNDQSIDLYEFNKAVVMKIWNLAFKWFKKNVFFIETKKLI